MIRIYSKLMCRSSFVAFPGLVESDVQLYFAELATDTGGSVEILLVKPVTRAHTRGQHKVACLSAATTAEATMSESIAESTFNDGPVGIFTYGSRTHGIITNDITQQAE
jgi:hypothetical protein